ncbi:hypothetical protein DL768_007410 [Monosporascus sp. mg162]|nr:hypothetical protein DL768_007410 [Monosporascus sp. mg162]
MFDGKDATELPSVQKLVERFRSHIRLRKAQGVTSEQLSRGAFGVTLNGKTPNQTGPSQNALSNSNRNSNQNGNRNSYQTPRTYICGKIYFFKECPYICPKIRANRWTEDPKVRKKVDEGIANGTGALKAAVKRAKKKTKEQTP